MNENILRLIKGVAAVIVLVVLILIVGRYWGDYRTKSADIKKTTETTPTVPAEGESKTTKPKTDTKTAESKTPAKTLQVTIDGLRLRKEPSGEGAPIRGLDAGEKLKLLKDGGEWYQVEDSKGDVGWISANPQYTKVVK